MRFALCALGSQVAALALTDGLGDDELAALGTGAHGRAKKDDTGAAVPFRAWGAVAEPHLVVPKLCLLLAALRRCGTPRVSFQPAVGSCAGMLVHPHFPVVVTA